MIGAIAFLGQTDAHMAAVLKKCQSAVYGITTDDLAGMGFAVAGGKYLITCDHVIGSDSKITIHDPKGLPRHGFLVFHDSKLDVAVYRLDRPSATSLKVSSDSTEPGKSVYVIGDAPDEPEPSIFSGTLTGVDRRPDRANLLFNTLASSKYSGTPILNVKGEVIGMSQVSPAGGKTLGTGISGYSLTQFLRKQGSPTEPTKYIGQLGQVIDTTAILASPDPDSISFFLAAPNQYLVVNEYSSDYMMVTLSNGSFGYVRSDMVDIVNSALTSGTPGIVNGSEVIRVLSAFDSSTLTATKTTSEWLKQCASFVAEIFVSSGRDISDDVLVQVDIGHDVVSADDLQVGDRVYFGKDNQLRAAIYVGNGQCTSVSKEGKLEAFPLPDRVSKPFVRAKH